MGFSLKNIRRSVAFSLLGISKKAMLSRIHNDSSFAVWLNGTAIYGSGNASANIQDGYIDSGHVYSIVNKIAKTAAMIPFTVYKVKSATALKEYQYISKEAHKSPEMAVKAMRLKQQAMDAVPEDNALQLLLNNPNTYTSGFEHRFGCYVNRLLTGNNYIYTPLLESINAGQVSELHIMPAASTLPMVISGYPPEVTGYEMNLFGIAKFEKDEVIHVKYFNPLFTHQNTQIVGLSPLMAGRKFLKKSEAETDYSVNSFENSGISGIVSNESIPAASASIEAVGQMKKQFYEEATGVRNARKLLFQAGKISYTHVGISPADMEVLKSEIQTFGNLCNIYGVSDTLFNNNAPGSESKITEMVRHLYTNAALPEVMALKDAYNTALTPKFNTAGAKYYIDYDITGITELQPDTKRMAEVFAALPTYVPNDAMEMLGWGRSKDPLMDKVYIKTGYLPLDELAGVPPLDVPTDNGN